MGEVYEAWDRELQISIALKTIRPRIASDAGVIERFKQEVKHAREISHPNICRVHELFGAEIPSPAPSDGATVRNARVWFLSMELLPGATLLEHLRSVGPFAPADALAITRQLVSGLAAAHARDLVHRDFKSSNVILVADGTARPRAVITDFGLSGKMLATGQHSGNHAGMGTPGYMAPEQERGGEVGPLADQYALGAVLCEMLTGSLPRWSAPHGPHGKLALDLPDIRTPGKPDGHVPGKWKAAICRCLESEPRRRFPQIGDVLNAIDPPGILRRPASIAAAAILVIAALIVGDFFWVHREAGCQICDLVQLTPDTDESESPAISRDNHTVAYSSDRADTGNLDIFLQRLPGGRPVRLTRDPARDGDPSLSPDGSVIAFRSERGGGGVYLVDAGGEGERLAVPRGRNPQISPDGKSLLYWTGDLDSGVASGRIFLQSLAGGPPVQLAPAFEDARFPMWSPDGRALVFSGCQSTGHGANQPSSTSASELTPARTLSACTEWWAVSLDGQRLVNTHALERLRSREIVLARPNVGFWYPDGLLFGAGVKGLSISLWAIPLDPATWEADGDPRQLLDAPVRDLSPSLSAARTIAYTRTSGALHIWQIEHALTPEQSRLSKLTEDAAIDGSPSVSEGGRWLVFARGRGSERGIWMRDNLSGAETLLFSPGLPTQSPIIDRDGQLLVYEQVEDSGPSIYARPRTGGAARRICSGCSLPTGWFGGDGWFFYRDGLPSAIRIANPRTGESRSVLAGKGASLSEATWSPATEHLLFTSATGGVKRIYAASMPRSSGEVTGPWIPIPDPGVSPDHPRWSGDGRTIIYTSNSDGFLCVYGWAFSPEREQVIGRPFPIAHFHNGRASIDNVIPRAFNLSVARDAIFLDLGEQNSTVWTGQLKK